MIVQDYTLFLTVLFTLCKETVQAPQPSTGFKVVDTCECGKRNELAPRIVGGQETEPNVYPWMVAILNEGRMHCGGSLINDRYILTAGHCLKWAKKEKLTVILGLHDRVLMEKRKKGGTIAEIDSLIVHEDFTSASFHDIQDIGLIKLKQPVTYNHDIRPICLPAKGADYAQKQVLVTGWGRMAQNGSPSKLLRRANITVLTNEECKKNEKIGQHILDTMICAYENDVDACQGDSGGPLIYETPSGKVEQVGVVSWGIGCASPGIPGVYTRTTTYLDWIASHTKDANYCKSPA